MSDTDLRFYGLIRDVGANCQDVRQCMHEIKNKYGLADDDLRAREIRAAIKKAKKLVTRNQCHVNDQLTALHGLCDSESEVHDWWGDEVTRIENLWERVKINLATALNRDTVTQNVLNTIDGLIGQLLYRCAEMTVPARVEQHLETIRAGQDFDFHKYFEDQVKSRDHRVKLLEFMHDHPDCIPGVVNVQAGTIRRIADSTIRRRLTYVFLLAALLLGGIFAWLLPHAGAWFDQDLWPLANTETGPTLLVIYLLLLAGAILHIVIDSVKQFQKGEGLRSLDDIFPWLHVNELRIICSIALVLVVTVALKFFVSDLSAQAAFFIGYTFDSSSDILLKRFDDTLVEHAKGIQKRMK